MGCHRNQARQWWQSSWPRSELSPHVNSSKRSRKVRDVRDLCHQGHSWEVPLLSLFTLQMISSDRVSKSFHFRNVTGVIWCLDFTDLPKPTTYLLCDLDKLTASLWASVFWGYTMKARDTIGTFKLCPQFYGDPRERLKGRHLFPCTFPPPYSA